MRKSYDDKPSKRTGREGQPKPKKRRQSPGPENDSGQEAKRRKKCVTNSAQKAGPRQGTLNEDLPRLAPRRLKEDLPKSACLHAVRTSEKRSSHIAFDLDTVPNEHAVRCATARPHQNPGPTPAEETALIALDLVRVGKSDIEAEPENEVPDGSERNRTTNVAERRSLQRVSKADATDQTLLSKHLPATIYEFLPNTVPGPNDNFVPPAWLMQATEEIAVSEAPTPLAPPIRFSLSDESVRFNSELLRESDLYLETFLAKHQNTTLNFGSKFRPIADLEKILGNHPNFGFFSEVLERGMDCRFIDYLTEAQRKAEVTAMMERGNHKSVQEDSDAVAKLLEKDVLQGFSLPVSPDLASLRSSPCNGPACRCCQAILAAGGWITSTEEPTNPRPLFPPHVPKCICKQTHQHGSVRRNDTRLVLVTRYPFYCRSAVGVPSPLDLHNEIRPLRCMQKSCTFAFGSSPVYHHIRRSRLHCSTTDFRWVPKPADLVLFLGNGHRPLQ
jgi:hypothetical protein